MTFDLIKKSTLILALSSLLSIPLQAMGKMPDKKYSAAPRPASQTPAYNNPFTSGSSVTSRLPDPQRNSNSAPAVKKAPIPPPYDPYGAQTPQTDSGVAPTPGSPGTASAPDTSSGSGVGAIGK